MTIVIFGVTFVSERGNFSYVSLRWFRYTRRAGTQPPGYFDVKKKQGSQTVTLKGNLAVQRCWTSERVYQLIYKL